MPHFNELPSGEGNEREQRLMRDLHRMYHSEVEDAQPLARVRRRLAESVPGFVHDSASTSQRHDRLTTLGEKPGNVKSTDSSVSLGRTWQQRLEIIAAVVFVTVLVGSLIIVLARARQNRSSTASIAGQVEALSSIHMLDTQTGWAMTVKGHIIRTLDGGVHWKNVTPHYPSTAGQQKVVADFFTASITWVAVSQTAADGTSTVVIFRTTDGGQTWQQTTIQQTSPIFQQTSPIFQVTFLDAQHGWMLSKQLDHASAEAVTIFRTTDGGKTWTVASSALASSIDTPPPGHLPFGGDKAGLGFLDAMTGWTTGAFPLNGYVFLYVTHDGGATWNRQLFPFSPGQAATQIVTGPPRFFTATDGILPVSFVTESTSSLALYVTHDGGITWKSTTPLAASATISDFIDMNHGWASDGTLLYGTSDGGQHWSSLSPGGSFQHVTQLDFVSSNIAWAISAPASNAPTLLKTEDGGHTWTVISYAIS
jgi:photosystem II stability/assembly factor-like uncharacterized protein